MEIKATGLAPFERVAESVRRAIRVGEWQPGQKLPSNRDLAKEHGVSLATLQKALALLQDEGWLVSRASVGVFVADALPAETRPASLQDLSRSVAELQAAMAAMQERLDRIEAAQFDEAT